MVVVDMEEVEVVVVALGVEEAVIMAEAEVGEEEGEAVEEAGVEMEMAEVEAEVEAETRTTVTEAALGKTEIRHNKLIIIVSVVMIKKCYA